jgi:CheY-like chemotaxis protein
MAQVLIAEDEAFTAMALVDVLEERGHTVRDAADGAAAIALLQSFSPDVLVTDLMMPNVDGAALIRHVRTRPGPTMPVILITGVPESKLPGGLEYDAYIGKPVDHDLLGQLIASLTGR